MNSVNRKHRTAEPRIGRGARLVFALALTLLAGLAAGTTTAQAGVVGPNTYRFQNLGSGLCLADSFAGGLQSLACTSQTTQHWRPITPTSASDQLQNVHTSRCLADSFADGLQALSCANVATQRWLIFSTSTATWRFRNVHTGRCLADSLDGGLRTVACEPTSTYQFWR